MGRRKLGKTQGITKVKSNFRIQCWRGTQPLREVPVPVLDKFPTLSINTV